MLLASALNHLFRGESICPEYGARRRKKISSWYGLSPFSLIFEDLLKKDPCRNKTQSGACRPLITKYYWIRK